jgi:hypothetical protein
LLRKYGKVNKVQFPYNRPWSPRGWVKVQLYSYFNFGARWSGWWTLGPPSLFTARKEILYQLYRRLGVLRGRSARVPKISPRTGVRSRTVQPVARRYTDWATPVAYVVEVNRTNIISFAVHEVPPMWCNTYNIVCTGVFVWRSRTFYCRFFSFISC